MTEACNVKSHKDWRKSVKKIRRKRIRQCLAEMRRKEEEERENSPTYLTQLVKERLLEENELEFYERERRECHEKWLKAEEEAQILWKEQQRLKDLAREEKMKELEKMRIEWEAEQKKIREKKIELERIKEEEERKKQESFERINDFLLYGGSVPLELQIIRETNPGKEICSFFSKVGACRFGPQCSRNHQHPGISKVLVFINFYSHFTLDQNLSTEYDTDIGLEFEDCDMYLHFREFYNDVVPELKCYGNVKMVKVCCNTEPHLRGNVYVEYKTFREAFVAYKKFQGRWYGGKQLNLEFINIMDWGSAVCGDFARKRCPKGKSCNFLHVFRNPKNEFPIEWNRSKSMSNITSNESVHCSLDSSIRDQSMRWSETPEKLRSHKKRNKYQCDELKYSRFKRKSNSREQDRNSRKSIGNGKRRKKISCHDENSSKKAKHRIEK